MIVKPKSIREQVYESLKEDIVNGMIKPGQKIVEVEYANKFGVSRTPLREALRMLELEGLVNTSEKGGVFVNFISEDDIIEIYKLRVALESLVLTEIAQKFSHDLGEVEEILEETRIALDEEVVDYDNVITIFGKFNNKLYETSRLSHVPKLITNLNLYTKRFRVLCLKDDSRLYDAFKEHCELIDALKQKDLDLALKINEKHLLLSMNFVLHKISDDEEQEPDVI